MLVRHLEDLVDKWPRASRDISEIGHGCSCILAAHWKTLVEEARRIQAQGSKISGSAGGGIESLLAAPKAESSQYPSPQPRS